jgi:hypothetical protein
MIYNPKWKLDYFCTKCVHPVLVCGENARGQLGTGHDEDDKDDNALFSIT